MAGPITGRRVIALLSTLLLALSACSSSDGNQEATGAEQTPEATAVDTEVAADAPLTVVVTNDDGIDAPGIDVLVEAIDTLDDVDVIVVAPLENQSVTGDKTSDGPVDHADAETLSGKAGTAVDGYPADTIGVALDDLGIEPDLVASGINEGQNVGSLAQVSGTVGAAMEAVRRGVPAVAGSAGLGDGADFEAAAELVVDWIVEHRDALADGTQPADVVVNINVPDCTAGSPRGTVEVPTADDIPDGMSPFNADCEVELDFESPEHDVHAVANGFAAISEVTVDESGSDDPDDAAETDDAEDQ